MEHIRYQAALCEAKGLIRQHNISCADAFIAKLEIREIIPSYGDVDKPLVFQRGSLPEKWYGIRSPSTLSEPIHLRLKLSPRRKPMVHYTRKCIPLADFLERSEALRNLSNRTYALWKALAEEQLDDFPDGLRDSAVKIWRSFNTFPRWIQLPAEIREHIARFAIFPPSSITVTPTRINLHSPKLNLALVNKAMHEVTTYLVYSRTTIGFISHHQYRETIHRLSQITRNKIRSIEILCYTKASFTTISSCYADLANLRHLSIDVSGLGGWPFFNPGFDDDYGASRRQLFQELWRFLRPCVTLIPEIQIVYGRIDVDKERLYRALELEKICIKEGIVLKDDNIWGF